MLVPGSASEKPVFHFDRVIEPYAAETFASEFLISDYRNAVAALLLFGKDPNSSGFRSVVPNAKRYGIQRPAEYFCVKAISEKGHYDEAALTAWKALSQDERTEAEEKFLTSCIPDLALKFPELLGMLDAMAEELANAVERIELPEDAQEPLSEASFAAATEAYGIALRMDSTVRILESSGRVAETLEDADSEE